MSSDSVMLALVVEDQPDTRAWLAQVLAVAFPTLRISSAGSCGEANAWLDALPDTDRRRLRLMLIDLVLPDGDGLDLIRRAREELEDTLPVVITAYDHDANLLDAIAAGAAGFLLKQHDQDTLVRCLRRLDDGEPPLTPSVARRILAHFQAIAAAGAASRHKPEGSDGLTPREVEVLALLGRGSRVAEVAACLGLTEQTVATYVKVIYRKLRISSRAEAALEAARRGLV